MSDIITILAIFFDDSKNYAAFPEKTACMFEVNTESK